VPWFGYQLFNGNSLVGARRQVYEIHLLEKHKKGEAWYDQPPIRLTPDSLNRARPLAAGEGRDEGFQGRTATQIYHFLLPDPGMANYKDRTAKALAPERFKQINDWRKAFTKPFDPEQITTLRALSDKIDLLWVEHTQQLAADRARTIDALKVWPDQPVESSSTTSHKDTIRASGIFNRNAKTASAYRRLKLVMDYWCALWFWPIDQAHLLPDRDTFLMEVGLLIHGNIVDIQPFQQNLELDDDHTESAVIEVQGVGEKNIIESKPVQTELPFPGRQIQTEMEFGTASDQLQFTDHKGQLHIESLFQHFPRLKLVDELADKNHFFHWELAFADIFASRGGFDLVLGNPPWIKVEWQEAGVLGDANPLFNLRKLSAKQLTDERAAAFEKYPELQAAWFSEYEGQEATQNFLNASQNYPLLKGVQTNLYKCFLPQGWMIGSKQGVSGFLHPEGTYDDPKGGLFRAAVYPRLRGHFQFHNELKLFSEVHHATMFSINIYGATHPIAFDHIANLFAPLTIDGCYQHNNQGAIPGIKNDQGKWNTSGHASRIIRVD